MQITRNLFLIKIAQKSGIYNSTSVANQFQFDFSSNKLFDQAFLFVQSGVILSSFFFYWFLLYKSIKVKRILIQSKVNVKNTILERGQKELGRRFYPGHIFIFKAAFKLLMHKLTLQFYQALEQFQRYFIQYIYQEVKLFTQWYQFVSLPSCYVSNPQHICIKLN
ncbi:unnamed protein product [Paramecium octaurelia]|uniref:Transmembrane protein n=1 Tax=Paramecium octaurelia TaxID=43137 RepID=A0A8S1WQH9_PAROT|nr:unnamed protein product [Paramecium octaurelia]